VITPRFYQQESIEGIFEFFRTHQEGNPIVALPPGAGKSVIIGEFIRRAVTQYPQTRILNIVHVKELISQSYKKLLELWPTAPVGLYSAGLKRRETHMPITFSGIASIARRPEIFGHIDLVLIDEADMVSHKEETQYRKVLKALLTINPNLRVIGLTGTPFRLGLGDLTDGGVFTHISTDYCSFEKFNVLIEHGFLCPLIPPSTELAMDVSGVHVSGGEFVEKELQEAVDKESITRAAIAEAVQLAKGRNRWLAFGVGVKHAENITAMLEEFGISAVCVHSDLKTFDLRFEPLTGETPRDTLIRVFKEGRVTCMVGVGIFGVGFDCPEVDCILMMRPTMSARIWIQYLGRGLRPHPSKSNTLVLDFAKNTIRLGCVNDPVLPGKKKKGKGPGLTPFKICPVCNVYNATRARFCSSCSYEFPEVVKIAETASDLDLIRREKPKPTPKPAVLEEYDVHRVEFAIHEPRDPSKGRSLKAAYHSGLRIFNEWLCFDSEKGFPRHKAHETWRLMAGTEAPKTTDEALMRVGELRPPVKIRVLHEGKYPQVVGYDFD